MWAAAPAFAGGGLGALVPRPRRMVAGRDARWPARVVLLTSSIAAARAEGAPITADAEALVVRLFHEEGRSLVRLARLFVDDRNAAEDLVQEAFLRLARHAHRIDDVGKAPAYLRSIVLNLARDHNRRGLVSLRHHSPAPLDDDVQPGADHPPTALLPDDELVRSDDHRRVLAAVRALPIRQRDCVTLRYFTELGIDAIATTLGLSPNSVKTHLKRGLANLERDLATAPDEPT